LQDSYKSKTAMKIYSYLGNGEDLSDFLSAQPNGIVKDVEIEYNLKLGKAFIKTDNTQVVKLLSKSFTISDVSAQEEALTAITPDRSGWIIVRK